MTKQEAERMQRIEDIYKLGLADLLSAYDHLHNAIQMQKRVGIEGLALFEHYKFHLLEMHRVLSAEYQRRWGSLHGLYTPPSPPPTGMNEQEARSVQTD